MSNQAWYSCGSMEMIVVDGRSNEKELHHSDACEIIAGMRGIVEAAIAWYDSEYPDIDGESHALESAIKEYKKANP